MTALEQMPHLDSITMFGVESDQEHFAENFLATKTKEAREQLVKRLSQFEELDWRRDHGICLHSIRFIQKYLTGLKIFRMFSRFEEDWEGVNQHLFCQTIMDIVCSLRASEVCFRMDIDILPEYLPLIVHKMFRDPAAASKSEKTQILQLKITDDNIEDDEMTLVGLDTRFDRREIILSVGTTADLTEIATNIFSNELPLENVEMFELIIVERYNKNIVANTRIYCKMLEGMKSINRVRIDVPAAFKEKSNSQNNSPEKYPLVRELTINATSGAKFQSLLN